MDRGTLRVRLSGADAHYGQNLVSMARIIELMADAGTELEIMDCGDEGLLACWKHIEQYVPVFAGDYVEVKSWFSRYGNTSRDMEAEVYKVCESADGGKTTACNLIDPPILVAKGSAVGVSPKDLDRGLQVKTREEIPFIPNDGKNWWENNK